VLRHNPLTAQRPSAVGLELTPQSASRIAPPRILIIEDELLIALMIEEMCREGGYRISGVAHTDELAKSELAKENYDAVLLDVSIGGRYHPKTADRLVTKGVPFAFVTGYEYLIDPRHEDVPILQKPFTPVELCAFLKTLVGLGSLSAKAAHSV
jgi:DNA-binding response OmpR family regulator